MKHIKIMSAASLEHAVKVLLDADLTPYDGVGSEGREDRETEDERDESGDGSGNSSRMSPEPMAAASKVRSFSNT